MQDHNIFANCASLHATCFFAQEAKLELKHANVLKTGSYGQTFVKMALTIYKQAMCPC